MPNNALQHETTGAERLRQIVSILNKHNVIDQSVPVFEAGQASGVIRAGDPLALSLAFWSVLQGVAEEIAVRPELPLPDAEWILAMVQPAPSGGAK